MVKTLRAVLEKNETNGKKKREQFYFWLNSLAIGHFVNGFKQTFRLSFAKLHLFHKFK